MTINDLRENLVFIQIIERPEQNKLLHSLRNSLRKNFSAKSGNSLLVAGELASYLYVLNRLEEAIELLQFIEQNLVFTGDHNIWTPVGNCICLLSRIRRHDGHIDESDRLLRRIVENPYNIPEPTVQKFNLTRVAKIRGLFESAAGNASDKMACNRLSNALFSCWYHSEIGQMLGMYLDEKRRTYMDSLQLNIDYGSELLRERLLKSA